ncbi:class III chitinase [Sistotremastrum niveocremeum HHB9708]|uniref:chitinase n=1 Tax=Sistotremastrum niveocremeum HHB9708 TaxID=1314777 RepID=A0A164UAZ6_9AGAM|nr:class III chitinase [Sistotremastrum niveocremeum HHB9708]
MLSFFTVILYCLPGLLLSGHAAAYDNTRYDNLVVYWGQNSYGATHSSDTANFQQTISYYCQDNSIDVLPVAFLNVFFGPGGLPEVNLANICNSSDDPVFAGSSLPNCGFLASSIQACQAKGKIVTLSLGGASGNNVFSSDAQAQSFADQIWNIFLGGSSSTRPFGSAVLDGVDLDIEGGGSSSFPAFVNQLRSHFSGASKKYYISAAPQCPYPDANLGAVLNAASFDAVYVQFYNNYCGLQNYNQPSAWNFGIWDYWARYVSPNPNVKIFIGAPASSTAAGGGYVDAGTLGGYAKTIRNSFPSFGGVMLWDASQAYVNGRYDAAIKGSLTAAGGTGFTYPSCSTAPAWVSGTQYAGGSKVSYQGFIWEAEYSASDAPAHNPTGDWTEISVCSGGGSAPPPTSTTTSTTTTHSTTTTSTTHSTTTTTSKTTSTTTTSKSTTTSSSPTPPAGGNCAGVAAWSSAVAYTGGSEVTYNGHLWTAKYWSEADVPGGAAGDWTDDGPCTTSKRGFRFNRMF